MSFHVGQKVVFLGWEGPTKGYGDEILPVKGCVYTVRAVLIDGFTHPQIRLCEIVNSERIYLWPDGVSRVSEAMYRASRFAPVRDTDISIFTAMLAPAPKQRERVT